MLATTMTTLAIMMEGLGNYWGLLAMTMPTLATMMRLSPPLTTTTTTTNTTLHASALALAGVGLVYRTSLCWNYKRLPHKTSSCGFVANASLPGLLI